MTNLLVFLYIHHNKALWLIICVTTWLQPYICLILTTKADCRSTKLPDIEHSFLSLVIVCLSFFLIQKNV